mgnify:CR=1 FL=1
MTTFELPLRIGARRSPLAQIQAKLVSDRLRTIHGLLAEEGAVETVLIQTEGDAVRDRPLSEIGGKGLFTKEIDRALINGRIDVAVHSMKDVPTVLPESLTIPCLLPREDPRDAWISFSGLSMAALPAGASVGTSSLRRQAQILARRPDLHVEPLRGNVDTRLKKLNLGEVDATLLAYAGLKRLGQEDVITEILSSDEMLPAIAQGAIGAQCRRTDDQVLGFLMPLNHSSTEIAVQAERAFLARLDGSCETPIAALCTLDGVGGLHLSGLMATSDGTEVIEGKIEGVHADGRKLGEELGARLLARAGPNFLTRKK